MLGSLSAMQSAKHRYVSSVLALAALVTLAVLLPSSARATGCTDSWVATGSGNWFVAANWSKNAVPTSEDEVCITESGTYTVEMAQKSTVTVKSLTLGGSEDTQTLLLASTNGLNAVLTTSAGIAVGAHGAMTLTNSETAGNSVTIAGTLTNSGTITSELGNGGQRNLQGNIVNTGTIAIDSNTSFNASKATLTNEGAIELGAGVALTASSETSVVNGSGGKIVATGTGTVQMESGTTFTEGAGTTSGGKPVVVRNGALKYVGGGESKITQHGEGGTLSGSLSAGQSLVLEATNGEHVRSTAAASFTNGGSITLTKIETSGNNATLVISSGTLTNSGTITSELGNGGQRNLQGNIVNTGTIAIDSNTSFNASKATLTNEGAIELGAGVALTASSETSVVNGSGGKIVATGTGTVQMESGTTFTEGAGTTSGGKPVVVRNGALKYVGGGESKITQHGEGGTLSGSLSAGQSLVLEATNGEHVRSTAAASFTNGGSITLTKIETSGNNATLVISSGTLTNSGTITSELGNGGQRNLQGNIVNTGTIAIDSNTSFNASKATLTNEGAIELGAGVALTASSETSVVNGSGGKIVATGTGTVQMESGTTFTEGAGTTSGGKPVVVRNGALKYVGGGESKITQHGEGGTLSGSLSAGQSLVLEATNGEHVRSTAAASFTNGGSITLTKIETSGNNATLVISSGTLTNSGTITSELGNGGQRNLQGNIVNTGTIAIDSNTSFNTSGATLTNEGAIDIATGAALSAMSSPTISNEAGGSINVTGNGVLAETTGTFNEGLGKTTTTKTSEPVVLDRVALHYTNKGASRIAQRGASTLIGPVNKGQTLLIQSTNSEHAEDAAAGGLTSSGTIVLTNAETSPDNVTLKLGGGTLDNKGKLEALFPKGGTRTIEGNLTNEKTLTIANSGNPLRVDGQFSEGEKATTKLTIAGPSSFGHLLATEAVSINGKLSLKQSKFKAKEKETFAIVSGSSLSGTFSSLTGQIIKGGGEYKPLYSPTAVTLEAT